MVHNIIKFHSLPFRGQTMKHSGRHSSGSGMGSVLLNTGGAGSASSYIDIDDYISQTKRDPFKQSQGKGLSSLSSKLRNLQIEPSHPKRSNIRM